MTTILTVYLGLDQGFKKNKKVLVFLNHKKKYDNFCENSHFFEIHGQNWGVRRGRNWFEKTKIFLFFLKP